MDPQALGNPLARDNSSKIGIFRRAAVERYSRPIDPDTPEMLSRSRPGFTLLGFLLLLFAFWLLL
jgi:hypothetical protein